MKKHPKKADELTRRGERTRAKLVEAARVGFERDGFAAARITEIAARARSAVGSFYTYFTTKADGTGLGLAIVKKIVVDHGGEIKAERSPLGGARFVVHLPGMKILAIAAAAKEARERARQQGVEVD